MPEYHYECQICGYKKSEFLSIKEFDTVFNCPECKTPLKKVVDGGPRFVLKGKGFHSTDYNKYGPKRK